VFFGPGERHERRKFWHDEFVRSVPAGAIEQQHGMGATLDVPADLIDVELHGKGVGKRQRQAGTFSFRGADGAEQIGVLVALIGRLPRAGPAFCPEPDDPVLLPDPRFVLKPDLDRLALGEVGEVGGQRPREVFLNAVTVAASWPG
jgi:hypothetical protein